MRNPLITRLLLFQSFVKKFYRIAKRLVNPRMKKPERMHIYIYLVTFGIYTITVIERTQLVASVMIAR